MADSEKPKQPVRVGVIGGSGIYKMEALTDVEEVKVHTPFGDPSDSIIIGTLCGWVPRGLLRVVLACFMWIST